MSNPHRQQADREQQTEQNMSDCLSVVSRWRSRWWQVQRLLRVGSTMLLLHIAQHPTVAWDLKKEQNSSRFTECRDVNVVLTIRNVNRGD